MRGVFVACLAFVLVADRQGDVDVARLVERAATYVAEYQTQLTSIVADETYTQNIRAQTPIDKGMPRSRILLSEIFFMFIPGYDWMAIRDVMKMNERPVTDRPDLRSALRSGSNYDIARRFKIFNSRYNLGHVVRNFNEPTLSLLVLTDAHRPRFRFQRQRVEGEGASRLVTLSFRERRGPTLVRNLKGGDAYATGELTIEPATGRVTRSVLALSIDSVRLTLTTTYAPDEKLGIWVPVRFGEWYEQGKAQRGDPRQWSAVESYEEILCEAKYTNFRRFEVKAQIR